MHVESGFVDVGVGRPFEPRASIVSAGVTAAHEVLLVDYAADSALAATLNDASRELSEYAICGTDERKVEVWHDALPRPAPFSPRRVRGTCDVPRHRLPAAAPSRLLHTRSAPAVRQVLASYVSRAMGGSMAYALYERTDFGSDVAAAKEAAGSDLVPLGLLSRGDARHRALLFKARKRPPPQP